MCYRPDFRASHARIGSALIPAPPSPFALEGFVIFLDHIFDTYDFHKLYGEALEPNLGHFRSAIGSIMHSEGRLRHHEYVNGGYQDLHLLAIYQDEWRALRQGGDQDDSIGHSEKSSRLRGLSRSISRSGDQMSSLAERLRTIAEPPATEKEG